MFLPHTSSYQLSDYWYDHEPLRMNHLPSFQTGARFFAIDSLEPSWAALYDIDATATFLHESYTRLRVNHSLREVDILGRLELLDRRTCELLYDSRKSQLTLSLATRNPTKFVVTHGIPSREERDSKDWAERTSRPLRNVKVGSGQEHSSVWTTSKPGSQLQEKDRECKSFLTLSQWRGSRKLGVIGELSV